MTRKLHPQTLAIRASKVQTSYGEHQQALFLSSSFMFESALEGAELFSGSREGYTYSRTANPTVTAFADRVAALEGAEAAVATSTGMAAIQATFLTFLKAGDHLVASKSLFGTTVGLIVNLLPRIGVEVTLVPQTDLAAWQNAMQPNTRMLFLETPSNPLNELADIEALSKIAKENKALLVVDNCFCSSAIQQPIVLGADISLQSATKAIDGQGRVMGGVVAGSRDLMHEVWLHVRSNGQTLSPFNAWVLLSGLETLFIRMEKQSASALNIAQFLQQKQQVKCVFYTGLPDHPNYDLVQKQQSSGGIVVAFELAGQAEAFKLVDTLQLFSRTANLGDVRSTVTHPWTTTHARMSAKDKLAAGIQEGLVRLSIGLEHVDDLREDLTQALHLL